MNYEQFSHTINNKEKSIFLVDMTQELEHFFSTLAQRGIGKYLRQGKRIGIIVNKKWFSSGIICRNCWFVPECKRCSIGVSYHKLDSGDQIWLCHICKTQYNLPTKCDKCWSEKIKWYGMGTQKVQEYLQQEFGAKSLIIESEKANSEKKIKNIMEELQQKKNEYPILIGTSLLSTAIPSYPLDLVIFLNADMGLNIPDYNVGEKNFNLLYHTFLHHQNAQFVIQTFNPEQYSIRHACKLDEDGFWEEENEFRKAHNYPPFADLCVLLYKNEVEEKVFTKVDKLHKELLYLKEKYQFHDLEIYSTPPLIYKIFGKYRYNIILKWTNLRNFMDIVYTKLNLVGKHFKVNWNADSIV